MPSPFPGMNPYLEQEAVWQDFHQGFIYAARAMLAPQVHPKYIVKAEEYIFLHELASEQRRPAGRPDLSIADLGRPPATTTNGGAILAPATVEIPAVAIDSERHSYLTLRDRQDLELVTVIELLSPANKTGPDRATYLDKRQRYILAGVNLVEIDLLRGGTRLPLTGLNPCDYYVMVARRQDQPSGGVWEINLRDRLPRIPIPLRPSDPDAQLDLQDVLNRVYDDALYENYIYLTPFTPPLTGDDAEWTRRLVPA